MKVHRIHEGYAWVPEKRDSSKIQEGRFQEVEVVEFRRLPTRVSRS